MRIGEQTIKIDSPLPILLLAVACTLSVLVIVSWPIEALITVAVSVLFLLFVKDLRLLVPIVLVSCPLGPKFNFGFGNLYLTTAILLIAYSARLWRLFLTDLSVGVPQTPPAKAKALMLAVFGASLSGSFTLLITDMTTLLRVVQFFLYTGLFLLVLEMHFEPRHAKHLMVLVLMIGAVEVVLGIGQVMTKGAFISGTFDELYTSYSAYMTFIGILVLGVLLEARHIWVWLLCLTMLILVGYTIIFSFCRTAYIAFPIGLATMVLMPFPFKHKLGLVIGIVGAALVVASVVSTDVAQRAMSIIVNLSGTKVGISFGLRMGFWERAFSDFLDNPILGGGLGTYGMADSCYLKFLAETGLIGISAFGWLVISILKATWGAAKAPLDDPFMRGIAKALFPATVAAIIVFNASGDYIFFHRFMGIYWIVLAVMLNYVERCHECK